LIFGQIDYLDVGELQFWQSLIQKYLRPIKKDKKMEEKIQQDLIAMRNNASFGFCMVNIIWVLLNFMLQLHVAPITIFVRSNGVPVRCEPLGFVFILFFLIVLSLQVIGMLKHR
jgi:chitin synthase